jgi:hypothetical protein
LRRDGIGGAGSSRHGPGNRPDKGALAPPGLIARVRTRSVRLRLRMRLGCATCAVVVLLVIGAAPAEAHLVGINAMPTNYATRVLAVSLPIQGLEVRAAEIGGALELINRTGRQVIVFGAQFEPYLRVEADGGVDENRRSPGGDPPLAGATTRRRPDHRDYR